MIGGAAAGKSSELLGRSPENRFAGRMPLSAARSGMLHMSQILRIMTILFVITVASDFSINHGYEKIPAERQMHRF